MMQREKRETGRQTGMRVGDGQRRDKQRKKETGRPVVAQMSKRVLCRGCDWWRRVGYEDPMDQKEQAESHHEKNRHHVKPTGVGLLCQACRLPLSD